MTNWFVSFSYQTDEGHGYGNTVIQIEGPFQVGPIQKEIQQALNMKSVVILNFIQTGWSKSQAVHS